MLFQTDSVKKVFGTFPNVSSNMFLIAAWGDVAASPPVGERKEGTINTSMVEGSRVRKRMESKL